MTRFKHAVLFVAFGFLLAPLSGSSRAAASDNTLGMALMSATVQTGAVVAGSGVTSFSHPTTGRYDITFDRGLESCTCAASFGAHSGEIDITTSNFISANCPPPNGASSQNVHVITRVNGSLLDAPFQLIVFCPK